MGIWESVNICLDKLTLGKILMGDDNSGRRSVKTDNFAAVLCDNVIEAAIATAELQNSELCLAEILKCRQHFSKWRYQISLMISRTVVCVIIRIIAKVFFID